MCPVCTETRNAVAEVGTRAPAYLGHANRPRRSPCDPRRAGRAVRALHGGVQQDCSSPLRHTARRTRPVLRLYALRGGNRMVREGWPARRSVSGEVKPEAGTTHCTLSDTTSDKTRIIYNVVSSNVEFVVQMVKVKNFCARPSSSRAHRDHRLAVPRLSHRARPARAPGPMLERFQLRRQSELARRKATQKRLTSRPASRFPSRR